MIQTLVMTTVVLKQHYFMKNMVQKPNLRQKSDKCIFCFPYFIIFTINLTFDTEAQP